MITRRQFLRRGALWVPSLAIARATLAQEQYLQNRRKAFRSQPAPAAGYSLWFKCPIAGLNNDDPVSTWPDSSPNGWNATSTTTLRPLYKTTGGPNGLSSVLFDGSNDVETVSTSANGILRNKGGCSIFAVWNSSATTTQGIFTIYIGTSSAARNCAELSRTTASREQVSARRLDADGIKQAVATSDYSTGTWYYGTWITDYTGAKGYVYRNGANVKTLDPFTSAGSTEDTDSITPPVIGKGAAGAILAGSISELIVYASALSSADQLATEAYLKWRWGL